MAASETVTIVFGTMNVTFTRTTVILPPQPPNESQYIYRIRAQVKEYAASFTLVLPAANRVEECVIMLVRDGIYGSLNHSVNDYADEYLVDDADAARIKERMEGIAAAWQELHIPLGLLESFYEETLG